MLRFFHMADYHFGIEFDSQQAQLRDLLRQHMRQAFEDMISRAISEQIDGLLIAGDLIDDSSIDPRNEIFLVQQMQRLHEAEIPIFMVNGNHDVAQDLEIPFAHVLSSKLEVIEQSAFRIVGQSFEQAFDLRTISDLPHFEDDRPTIGLFHSLIVPTIEADNRQSYLVSTVNELEASGYDYIALGHVHERCSYGQQRQIHYPGSFFPVRRSELGLRGYLDVRIGEQLKVHFQPASRIRFERIETEITSQENFRMQTYDQLKQLIQPDQIMQITLRGHLTPQELMDLPEILDLVREEADQLVSFNDQTQMAPEAELKHYPFFEELLDQFESKVFDQIDQTELYAQSPQTYRLWYARNKALVRRMLLQSFYKRGQ